jgi:hypothetical protein
MTAAEFVDRIFYPIAKAGARIVGFNLPFDISRLAIGHDTARAVRRAGGKVDRSMQGGFSFTLSPDAKKGHVRISTYLAGRRLSILRGQARSVDFFSILKPLPPH